MIEHVFVLMLENRSFDHLLGFSGLEGKDPAGNATKIDGLTGKEFNPTPVGSTVSVSAPADFLMEHGPGHEFKDVREQLCGRGGGYSTPAPQLGEVDPKITNKGYVSNYSRYDRKTPEKIMKCFSPQQVPVLTALAKEYAVCDRWFSSMPGPTWPNRFFVHAASSAGLDDSPSFSREFKSIATDGFKFDNGTIYDQLDNGKRDWTIYCADEFPQVLSIAGMRANFEKHFRPFDQFKQDLGDPSFSQSYVFIEPDYHAFTGKFRGGNSQHPEDDVTSGERFLKDVYETIRGSPKWESSVLVITYDEHWGFYDHVAPPATVHPGDSITNPGNNHNNFDFRQLGARVPTVIVSPLIPKGTVDHTVYDHTSVLATVEELFKLGKLTKRDGSAQTLSHLLKLKIPRSDTPATLPEAAVSGYVHKGDEKERTLDALVTRLISFIRHEPVEPGLQGFHHVAFQRDLLYSSADETEKLSRHFLRRHRYGATRYMRQVRRDARAVAMAKASSAKSRRKNAGGGI